MEEYLNKIEEYYNAIRMCDFYRHRQLIIKTINLVGGLAEAIGEKGIITQEEWDAGIEKERKEHEEEMEKINENLENAINNKERIEKELLKMKEELEKDPVERLAEQIFGCSNEKKG